MSFRLFSNNLFWIAALLSDSSVSSDERMVTCVPTDKSASYTSAGRLAYYLVVPNIVYSYTIRHTPLKTFKDVSA